MKPIFICPRCKKPTIQPVQEWEHDFLSIHKYEMRMIESSAGKLVECEVFEGCDSIGSLPRVARIPIEVKKKVRKVEKVKISEAVDSLF